jgi:hypothetical protein
MVEVMFIVSDKCDNHVSKEVIIKELKKFPDWIKEKIGKVCFTPHIHNKIIVYKEGRGILVAPYSEDTIVFGLTYIISSLILKYVLGSDAYLRFVGIAIDRPFGDIPVTEDFCRSMVLYLTDKRELSKLSPQRYERMRVIYNSLSSSKFEEVNENA